MFFWNRKPFVAEIEASNNTFLSLKLSWCLKVKLLEKEKYIILKMFPLLGERFHYLGSSACPMWMMISKKFFQAETTLLLFVYSKLVCAETIEVTKSSIFSQLISGGSTQKFKMFKKFNVLKVQASKLKNVNFILLEMCLFELCTYLQNIELYFDILPQVSF